MSDRPMRQKQSVSQIVLFVHNQTTIVKIISIASKRWKPITSQQEQRRQNRFGKLSNALQDTQ